ncbi:hypothetical protein DQM68_18960 [Leptospira mayottensis]|uniref:Uncharacterized protein n=2 Tax=Leptospira mayottensis TaxID=1137606 RepID=A0AA87MMQ2_9LEPT|nr:hypothetical protein DQM68_18960 [Leptospira mayottensis]AXR66359.1 hypothetical protein DQM28_19265 [Leptospira mayottensis]AXR70141.1 hypothetical protein DPV73_19385 [Leptospira mayottensis]AZQ04132.1 hypothetical protein LEP1GSC190_19035 [Leptospira mayottensis 200901116]EKR99142.1 hypothetical protein LEP1GSC125_3651 [Leptospira mayottensis 200901122]
MKKLKNSTVIFPNDPLIRSFINYSKIIGKTNTIIFTFYGINSRFIAKRGHNVAKTKRPL